MEIQEITARAYTRVINELGPWPPVELNPDALSEDEKVAIAMRDLGKNGMGLAALRDGNKKRESEHFADEGA
jgi:hypothetical protein